MSRTRLRNPLYFLLHRVPVSLTRVRGKTREKRINQDRITPIYIYSWFRRDNLIFLSLFPSPFLLSTFSVSLLYPRYEMPLRGRARFREQGCLIQSPSYSREEQRSPPGYCEIYRRKVVKSVDWLFLFFLSLSFYDVLPNTKLADIALQGDLLSWQFLFIEHKCNCSSRLCNARPCRAKRDSRTRRLRPSPRFIDECPDPVASLK